MKKELITNYLLGKAKNIFKPACNNLRYPFIVPGEGYMNELWGWDSYWVAHSLRYMFGRFGDFFMEKHGIERGDALLHMKGSVLDFFDSQSADGFIPSMLAEEGIFKDFFADEIRKGHKHNQHAPFLCQSALGAAQFAGDYGWLDVEKLISYLEYYKNNQYDVKSGLFFWQNDIMIGIDNNPTVFCRPPRSSADIFLNCFIYLEYVALAKILAAKGDDRSDNIMVQAERLKRAINDEMWDERDGIYYSQDISFSHSDFSACGVKLHSGMPPHWKSMPLKIRIWACFLPMYAGICSAERADRMCTHLTSDDTVLANYGIRTLASNEKMYCLENSKGNPSNWLGPIWTVANYCVYKGLKNYGKAELSKEVAHRTVAFMENSLEKYGDLFESYNPNSGKPYMHPGFLSFNMLVSEMM